MTKHDPNRADQILAIIKDYAVEYGYPPTIREIGERVGLASTSAVWHHLRGLERAGRIQRGRAGRVRLTHSAADDAVYAVMMDKRVAELSAETQDLLVAAFRPRRPA